MAQRKSPPSTPKKSGTQQKVSPAKAGTPAKAAANSFARPPAKKKPGKSIVNQKQTPWGLIATTAVVLIFAVLDAGFDNDGLRSAMGLLSVRATVEITPSVGRWSERRRCAAIRQAAGPRIRRGDATTITLWIQLLSPPRYARPSRRRSTPVS